MGFLKQAFNLVGSPSHSRTVGIIIVLFILAIVPLTVVVSQQQQEIRQRAAGQYCNDSGERCPNGQTCNITSCDTLGTFCEGTCVPVPTPTSPPCAELNQSCEPWLGSPCCTGLVCVKNTFCANPTPTSPRPTSTPTQTPTPTSPPLPTATPTPPPGVPTPTSAPQPLPVTPTPTKSPKPTPTLIPTEKSCSDAPLKLTLSPNPAYVGGTFNATAFFGLSVCRNYFVNFDKRNTTKRQWETIDSCIIDINGRCEQTFPSLAGNYRATIDKNDNRIIEPKDGEEDRGTLSVIIAPTPTPTSPPLPTAIPTPTPTPLPGSTQLALSLTLEGIGADRISLPIALSPVTIEVFNSSDKLVLTKTDKVVYQSKNGKFDRTVNIGNTLPKGEYTIKIKIDNFLKKQVDDVFKVQSTTTTQTIPVSTTPLNPLLAGDINNDGNINSLDYNAVLNCFGSKKNTPSCTDKSSDINYDKAVNGIDHNITIRNFGKTDD